MDFAFSEEQEQFRAGVARFVSERWPLAESRRRSEGGESGLSGRPDPDSPQWKLWRQLASELGLPGLAVPERFGGQGFGFLELGIALEELGRALAGGPLFATGCLAARALLHSADEAACNEWLPALASGEPTATLAWLEPPGSPPVRYEGGGEAARVTGEKTHVIDAAGAGLLLVTAQVPMGGASSLLAVSADAAGVDIVPLDVLDPTRPQARVILAGAPARLAGAEGCGTAVLTRTLDEAAIALGAEMLGGAAQCLADATAYARERIQFARPIGSFQAIKHRAAEVLLELETARAAAYWSWWVADRTDDPKELREAADVAHALCADAYLAAADANLHIHGGMGFTWEADPHLYLRRARSSAILLGTPGAHRARLARTLGFGAPPSST